MDEVVPGNKISDTLCEEQCIEDGDYYCGNIDEVAVYITGMYKTTTVAVKYCNI